MKILILGGDGYLGWPTAMYFSNRGYDVTVVDNYFRRNACAELDVGMLYPVPTLIERAKIWHELTGKEIKVVVGDLTDPEIMRALFNGSVTYIWAVDKTFAGIPDTVIHYAEQPSAPYSLINYKYANITITNNLLVTNNLMFALRDFSRDTHVIHIGTMGEYGTPNIDIEEGWLEIEHKGRKDTFLFPRQASSLYHTTKIMDTDLMWFAVRMWDLRVTDLMQGPVYGIETPESLITEKLSPQHSVPSPNLSPQTSTLSPEYTPNSSLLTPHLNLNTIFNYDEIFGTILNRFIVQAIVDYPLTVYGKGGQTRGYLNTSTQRRFTVKWLKASWWIIFPIVFVDAIGKPIFLLINGAQYEKAYFILVIFSLGIWLSLTFSPLVNVLRSRKAFKFLFALGVAALIVNYTGNYLFIPVWGAFGAAAVTIFSHALINIASAIKIFLSDK